MREKTGTTVGIRWVAAVGRVGPKAGCQVGIAFAIAEFGRPGPTTRRMYDKKEQRHHQDTLQIHHSQAPLLDLLEHYLEPSCSFQACPHEWQTIAGSSPHVL
jgi:hypothetical protein